MRQTISIFLLLFWFSGQAQTTDEWLNQKKTQLRYLGEQIAALKVYAGHLDEGYRLIKGGLRLIEDVKNEEFSLHKSYFEDLRRTKPFIRNSWQVAAILYSAKQIAALHHRSLVVTQELARYSKQYGRTASRSWNSLLGVLQNTLAELNLALENQAVSLSDHDRLVWIEALYQQVQVHEQFAVDLYASTRALAANMQLEGAHTKTVRSLYEK